MLAVCDRSCTICRTYALLFKRFLQSKLRLGASHSRHKASFTSTAEAEVPALSQQLSCKANITTDFCRRVALQAELQWKARAQQASKRTLDVCKTGQSSLSSMTTKPHARHIDVQQHIDDNWQPQILCPVWVSQPKSPLPWRATPLPRPTPVYTHKQRATYGRGTEEKGERQNDAEQQGGFGRQCTLQIKGCPEGKPKPTWHLRMQESLGRKTQLRGRASALLTPVSFLPSKWQMEIRHRLPKGATFHAKLQGEDVQQPGHCSTSRHRLLLQRKARDAWWTCTCAHDSAGTSFPVVVSVFNIDCIINTRCCWRTCHKHAMLLRIHRGFVCLCHVYCVRGNCHVQCNCRSLLQH